jgi:hypothetical protein
VTFLGSKRRESLLGTGARANAYTDFHHTVFHVHAPVKNAITNTDMLPQVGLLEVVFPGARGGVQCCRHDARGGGGHQCLHTFIVDSAGIRNDCKQY